MDASGEKAGEYIKKRQPYIRFFVVSSDVKRAFIDGAKHGYNIGYRKTMAIEDKIEQAEKDKTYFRMEKS